MLKRSPAGNKEMNMQRRDFLNIPCAGGCQRITTLEPRGFRG
jgi:hypothetical protein